jgi:hypothetical protein
MAFRLLIKPLLAAGVWTRQYRMSIAAYRGGSALSKKRAKIHMTTARRAESVWHFYKLRHSAAAAIRRGQDLPPSPRHRPDRSAVNAWSF